MISIRHPRTRAALHERLQRAARRNTPWAERALQALGGHPSFTDAVLGDLAEESARRREREGESVARWWYAREALRSVPHLLWNAVQHGGARGRARAAAIIAAAALVPAVVLAVLFLLDGPPARLVADGQGSGGSHGIILNGRQVQLGMRVFDAKGRPLRSTHVRYQWISGVPLRITPGGVVTCTRPADATVRASAGAVATTVLLHCRPVKDLVAEEGIHLVVGGSGKDLAFMAVGPDGRAVDLLAGEMHVEDSTIATVNSTTIQPIRPGRTRVVLRIGDHETDTQVTVFEPVETFDGLRADQRYVVAPVRVTRGDTIRWSLPKGLFWLSYGGASDAQPIPAFAVDGPVMCMPDFGPKVDYVHCLVRRPGASLRITYPRTATTRPISGSIAIEFPP